MHAASSSRLSGVLLAQHGAITTSQVRSAECDAHLPAREVAAARWREVGHGQGVFLTGPDLEDPVERAWGAQLLGGPDSVISGGLACQLHGLVDVPSGEVVVLVGRDVPRRGAEGIVVRRTARLPVAASRDDGVRLAPVGRAVVDAARGCTSLRNVRGLVLAALGAGRTRTAALLSELDAGPVGGSALCRRAVRDWTDGARSAPEAEAADELRRTMGMPPYLLNPVLWLNGVLLGSPDIYVQGRALGGEMDSRRHHGSAEDLDATLWRHARFSGARIVLEHITPTRFRADPAGWARAFAELAKARPIWEPAGLRVVPAGPLHPVRGRRPDPRPERGPRHQPR